MLWQAPGERVALEVQGMRQVIHARKQRPEGFAIVDHAADRRASEADAVIPLLASDQSLTVSFATRAVIRQRDLERRVHRLGAGIGEEHMIEAGRSDARQ